MRNKEKLILSGILGLSLGVNAQDVKIGIPLIKREEIQKIAEAYKFSDMEISLLESGILKEQKIRDYYVISTNRLKEETKLSLSEDDEYIFNILKEISLRRTVLTVRQFRDMSSSTQDFSPMVKIDGTKINERFQKREP